MLFYVLYNVKETFYNYKYTVLGVFISEENAKKARNEWDQTHNSTSGWVEIEEEEWETDFNL
jgi:hypothetical protein